MSERVYTQAEKDDAWNSVYSPMAMAMRIVAFELGRKELRDIVLTVLESDSPLRYLNAVRALEQRDEYASRLVIDRNRVLNGEDYNRQIAKAETIGKTAVADGELIYLLEKPDSPRVMDF